MANLLQSAQTQATTAPGFYTDYLSNIAQKGTQAQQQAQYVGAQPLQQQAFTAASQGAGSSQPAFQTAQQLAGMGGVQNISGAATPYLMAGTSASPLAAAQPLICGSTNLDIAGLAGQYMSPYIQNVAQSVSDIGQRNIRQNLSPLATAAAVGSGQFGSQRGAQVLGQIQANAQQDLNNQIGQLLNTGYGQALCAAKAKQQTMSQLAGTTVTAQQAQNEANLRAAAVAGCSAAKQALALTQAGQTLGTLGAQGTTSRLACINALATLGGQQQTIAQNQQLFPLTSLSSLASLLSGYTMPTTTKTTLCMSPLSGLAAVGSGALGMMQPRYDASGKEIPNSSPWSLIKSVFGSKPSTPTPGGSTPIDNNIPDYIGGQPDTGTGGSGYGCIPDYIGGGCSASEELPWWAQGCASGGSVQGRAMGGPIGCGSSMGIGAAPAGLCFAACITCTPFNDQGGVADGIAVGCASTQNLGALPNMG